VVGYLGHSPEELALGNGLGEVAGGRETGTSLAQLLLEGAVSFARCRLVAIMLLMGIMGE